jgi:hypothetical protein
MRSAASCAFFFWSPADAAKLVFVCFDAESANIYNEVLLLNLNSCEVLPDVMLLPVLQNVR